MTDPVQVLLVQYHRFFELYVHEDMLTWSKFNNMLYINAAFGAILGFFVENRERLTFLSIHEVMWVMALLGLLVSLAFAVTIYYGTVYLLVRKEAVERIEIELLKHGALPVFHQTKDQKRPFFLRFSPTRWVLRLAPLLLAMVWLGLALVPLLRPLGPSNPTAQVTPPPLEFGVEP